MNHARLAFALVLTASLALVSVSAAAQGEAPRVAGGLSRPASPYPSAHLERAPASTPLVLDGTTVVHLTSAESAERAALDRQSAWITGLYVGALGALGSALALAVGAIFAALGNAFSHGDGVGASVLGGVGLGLAGLSPIALGIAIGLDVDAGSRRGGLERRVRLRVSEDRAEVALATAF